MIPDESYRLSSRTPAETSSSILLQGLVQAITADVMAALEHRIRDVVRQELRNGRGTSAEWIAPGQAAAVAGVSPATIRRWVAAGILERGRRGRIRLEQLHQVLARDPKAPTAPSDLATARARRAAQAVKEKPST